MSRSAVNAWMAAVLALSAGTACVARADDAVPNFAPDPNTGWQTPEDEFIPPPSGPGPIQSDPAHPYLSFYKYPRNLHPAYRVADLSNPILLPWTRDALQRANQRALSGAEVALPKERCWPVGVPAFSILPATPVYFLQTPKEVVMIWTQDHQVRHVWLNQNHSAARKPGWFGESVGHYEGDTLVVDTVGIDTRTFVDNYFTPHTDRLHVIERYRMTDAGKTLQVDLHVEDPGAFATPWNAVQRYRLVTAGPMPETVCAENNGDHYNHGLDPMPQATIADF
ncbi:MAG TPA: hypothetical protein VFW28_12555 [Micropepsaceae bacterium]|nr:hypothetical protein [Micropepsaceae bacterium]